MSDLEPSARDALRGVAEGVASHGRRLWLVGGAVRDLALDLEPVDFDVCSATPPEDVEAWFERTVPVGRDFGTLLISIGGLSIQHTTFRTESSYADARRPDRVEWGSSLEEDARRRDFTCNALFLDPLTDELRDPERGLDDLRARRLRAVGNAAERFREDGLRIWRLARFAAGYELAVEDATAAGARAHADSLRGVSPERVLGELTRLFERPGAARALQLLEELGMFPGALPGLPAGADVGQAASRLAEARSPSLELALALLYEPEDGDRDRAKAQLDELRVSRHTRRRVTELWALAGTVTAWADEPPRTSQRVRARRRDEWAEACELARLTAASPSLRTAIESERAKADALGPELLELAPWIESADLRAAGVAPGERWGSLLREAEDLQLDGAWASREEALAWLRGREDHAQ